MFMDLLRLQNGCGLDNKATFVKYVEVDHEIFQDKSRPPKSATPLGFVLLGVHSFFCRCW